MDHPADPLIVRRLRHADSLLEIGIGDRTGVAAGLVAAGADVHATDVRPVSVPDGVRFRIEDVTTVEQPDSFHEVDVVYALNCPPDLHGPILALARVAGAAFQFTTLGYDEPAIPVERESLGGGADPRVTLYTAKRSTPGQK